MERYTISTPGGPVVINIPELSATSCRRRELVVEQLLNELVQTAYWEHRVSGQPGEPEMELGGHNVRVGLLRLLTGEYEVKISFI